MTASPETDASTRLPDEVVRDLLADDECRRALSCLADRDEPMAVEDLARALAERDAAADEQESGADDRETTETVDAETVSTRREDLFQRLLPKLTPTGVVAYDSMLGTVALDTTDERIRGALD